MLALSAGAHYMQVTKWLGHESYVTTLTIYADYIPEDDGGKEVPVARPAKAESLPSCPERHTVSTA
jgi:integrase